MPRPLPPLWLTAPTRFAGIDRRRAIVASILLLLLIALGLTALATPDPTEIPAAEASASSDLSMYDGVIEGLRAGGDYYTLTAQALRAGNYPLKPFVTFRLPTHAIVQAALPLQVTIALLYMLALGVAVAWWNRLRPVLARPPARFSAGILIIAGLVAFVQASLVGFHEIWAALLVALALAIRTPERWAPSIAIGLIAMLVRETAALLPLVMIACAWREGARREVVGWAIALLAFALVLAAHAWAVSHVVGPLDPSSPGWSGLNGFGFFIRAFVGSTALQVLPLMLSAPIVVLALFGWSAWRDPLGVRALLLFTGYAVAISVFARADTFYWALLPAPILLVGLIFAPDAVRDLGRALLDRRRVRVVRISQ